MLPCDIKQIKQPAARFEKGEWMNTVATSYKHNGVPVSILPGVPFYFADFGSILYVPQPKGRRVSLVRSEAEEAPAPAAHLSSESSGGGTYFRFH